MNEICALSDGGMVVSPRAHLLLDNLTTLLGHRGIVRGMAVTFSVHEAKSQLSRLLSLAESGEQIEITRHGKVVAVVTGAAWATRRPGSGIGTVHYGEESFDLTDDEVETMFHAEIET